MRSLVLTLISPGDGQYITDSIILDLFKGAVTGLSFKGINIHPYNLGNDKTTVVCDSSVFTTQDLANLGFKCQEGKYEATT